MDLSNKNNRIIIFFITWFGGIFGIHWFVQKNPIKGIFYLLTAGCFIVGWIYDTVKTFINIFNYDPLYMKIQSKNKDQDIQERENNIKQFEKELSDRKNREAAIQSMKLQAENFNRILTDVQCGYKNIDPYLSRYRILLEIYYEMEETNNKYKLSMLSYTSKELYDTFYNELNKFIKDKILITLDKHSIDVDEHKALKKDLMKIRNDIIECKHKYQEFSSLLEKLQFQLEDEIKKL